MNPHAEELKALRSSLAAERRRREDAEVGRLRVDGWFGFRFYPALRRTGLQGRSIVVPGVDIHPQHSCNSSVADIAVTSVLGSIGCQEASV